MKGTDSYNPVVIAIYFLAVTGIIMFCIEPVLLSLSLLGALLFYFLRNGGKNMRSHLFSLALFAVMALINPLVSHNGRTVLFVINDSPITLEALLYGVAAATMIISVLYWFRLFTQIMTSDRLLYVFGKLSPKLSLVISMGLRYVPLFGRQAKKIRQTQKALGLYKDRTLIDRARGDVRVFSVMTTWALENGIITADSMTARGYGIGRRSHFSIFKLRAKDLILLSLTIVFFAITCVCIALGALDFSFYPSAKWEALSSASVLGYVSYGALVLLPTFIEAEEIIRWKYLKSKI